VTAFRSKALLGSLHHYCADALTSKLGIHINGDDVSETALVPLANEEAGNIRRFPSIRFSDDGESTRRFHVVFQLALGVCDAARKTLLVKLPKQLELTGAEISERDGHTLI
jgi:hypothetical protein